MRRRTKEEIEVAAGTSIARDGKARCACCLGMGYKGRTERGAWKIRTCPRCGGSGEMPVRS